MNSTFDPRLKWGDYPGIPWADLPARFGKHDTVRKRFDRWSASSVWQKIAQASGDPVIPPF